MCGVILVMEKVKRAVDVRGSSLVLLGGGIMNLMGNSKQELLQWRTSLEIANQNLGRIQNLKNQFHQFNFSQK